MGTQDRIVVILGAVAVLSVLGGLILTFAGKQVPDSIIALGSAGVGAIASFLVQAKNGAE